ncbi:MAG: Asp-tRNA(Asn)/Glu-tRNA(Gln) amidotransferase subunit GatC [Chlorobi bacterium]|nr:Asp-tRNA(Asn)/Glu-tRNA(Gln) amidotransferase subunit GatC [Chlorobiota bacterium]
MSVTREEVLKIAGLAKLRIPDEKLDKYTEDLNSILGYMEKLNELDTSEVEPLLHPLEGSAVFREDEPRPSVSTEEALKNAPDKTDAHFKVPKVIKTGK